MIDFPLVEVFDQNCISFQKKSCLKSKQLSLMQELLSEGVLPFFLMQDESDMGTIISQIVVVIVEK